ncbi:MAG: hypothetical protein MEQ74_06575 [Paracoccus sp.]|nr:hypothetical protein [Paracoccus sp. (in: a-proteobacteria)]
MYDDSRCAAFCGWWNWVPEAAGVAADIGSFAVGVVAVFSAIFAANKFNDYLNNKLVDEKFARKERINNAALDILDASASVADQVLNDKIGALLASNNKEARMSANFVRLAALGAAGDIVSAAVDVRVSYIACVRMYAAQEGATDRYLAALNQLSEKRNVLAMRIRSYSEADISKAGNS